MKKREYSLLAAILVLSLGLRFISFQTRSIQYDDAFSIFLAVRSLPEIIQGTAADTMPPLYYFLLHYWEQVSMNLGWLRFLSILLSMGCVMWIYMITRSLYEPFAALWAAFLVGISPLQIYHAQDIRMYALLAFCQLGYGYFFIQLWKRRQNPDPQSTLRCWVGMIILGTLAMYTHNLAIFGLVVPNVWLLMKRQWRFFGQLLLAQMAILVLCIPWLWMVPGQVEKIQHAFWTPKPGIVEVIQAVILFVATLPLPGLWLVVAAILSIQVVVLVVLEIRQDKEHPVENGLLLSLILIPPVLLFLASYLIRPVFVTRGFITSGIYFLGLSAVAISLGWKKKTGILLLSFFIASAVISLVYQIPFGEFPRSPFQEGTAYLRQQNTQGEVILHDNKLSYFPSRFYAPDLSQQFLADAPGSTNDTYAKASQVAMQIIPADAPAEVVKDDKGIYFVVFTQALQEYRLAGTIHPVISWLTDHYHLADHVAFNDLEIYHFER